MRRKDEEFAGAPASCVATTPALLREEYNYPYLDPLPKRNPPTNADRIRAMSDEELLEFLIAVEVDGIAETTADLRDWLRQPVEATL